MRFGPQYRRSPYSVIASRWRRHIIHILAIVGGMAVLYLAWGLSR